MIQPSRFWETLNRRHTDLLFDESDFRNFKRTVNTSYFQFGAAAFVKSVPILIGNWLRNPDPRVVRAAVVGQTGVGAHVLGILLALYANAVRQRPGGGLLDRIGEPELGNPILVRYGDRLVTEDLCHSVENTRLPLAYCDLLACGTPSEIGEMRRAAEGVRVRERSTGDPIPRRGYPARALRLSAVPHVRSAGRPCVQV